MIGGPSLESDLIHSIGGHASVDDISKTTSVKRSRRSRKVPTSSSIPYVKDNGVQIEQNPLSRIVDPRDIAKQFGKHRAIRENLFEWNSKDFTMYMRDLFMEKTHRGWGLSEPGVTKYIMRIRDQLEEFFGMCDNLVLRDYIRFFFTYYFDVHVQKERLFTPYVLLDYNLMTEFVKGYDYLRSLQSDQSKPIPPKQSAQIVTRKTLEAAMSLSLGRLICDYGIVVAINWLIIGKSYTVSTAVDAVYKHVRTLCSKGLCKMIIESTRNRAPYPDNWPFKNQAEYLQQVDRSLVVDIVFSSDSRVTSLFPFTEKEL